MAKVRKLYDVVTREPYFFEGETGRMFRRIVGALAWPYGETDGCMLVLGEIRAATVARHNRRHEVFVPEEYTSPDAARLVDEAGRMQDNWLVRSWSTPISDQRVWMIDDYNDAQRRGRKPPLKIGDPEGWTTKHGEGLIPIYFALVQRLTKGEKTLHFGPQSAAALQMDALDTTDMGGQVLIRPSAAAAFWAVAAIDMAPMPEWGERRDSGLGPADPVGGY